MVKVEYDDTRNVTVVTISGANVEVVYDMPKAQVEEDETPDGLPLIVLAA